MVSREDKIQLRKVTLSFPEGETVLKKVDRLPKKQQTVYYNQLNKRGVGIITAFKRATGRIP